MTIEAGVTNTAWGEVKGVESVNGPIDSASRPRLSDVLFSEPCAGFHRLATVEGNADALDAGLLFAAGKEPFLSLSGPSGCGKTQLLHAIGQTLTRSLRTEIPAHHALSFVEQVHRPDGPAPLLLDDVQDVLARPKLALSLRRLLERRVRAGRPTILCFTMESATRSIRRILPSPREWRICEFAPLTPQDRLVVLDHVSHQERMVLGRPLSRILAGYLRGQGQVVASTLRRLSLDGNVWLDARKGLYALGAAEAFFADNSAWDLGRRVMKIAEYERPRFPKVIAVDLAIYVMFRECHIAEEDIARTVGLPPGDVFTRVNRFSHQMEHDEDLDRYVTILAEFVLESLQPSNLKASIPAESR